MISFRFVALLTLIGFSFCAATALAEDKSAKKYLIIHTDDAGMSHAVNVGTIEAMENGIVSSASIMVPCPWLPEFAEYARKNPDKDYGIHMTVNSEFKKYRWGPVAPPEKVPSLLDKDGYLHHGAMAVVSNARAEEVEIELRAQIDKALSMGIPLSHLDSHMGTLFMRKDLFEVYMKMGVEYDLPVLFTDKVEPRYARAYPGWVHKIEEKAKFTKERGMPILSTIFMYYEGGDYAERKNVYLDVIRKKLKPGVNEIIIHCGVHGPELDNITGSSQLRDSDRLIFQDKEVIEEIEKLGIEVITWKQAVEITRKQTAFSE